MLKRLGHNVRILEQHRSSPRDGQAAGVSTWAQTQQFQRFLGKYDLVTEPCVCPPLVRRSLTVDSFQNTTRKMLHYRLRANSDSFGSEYLPNPPGKLLNGDGRAVFDIGKHVTGASHADGGYHTEVRRLDQWWRGRHVGRPCRCRRWIPIHQFVNCSLQQCEQLIH